MIATGHTPGPWKINTAGMAINGQPFKITEVYVFAPDLKDDVAICADVINPVTQEPSEANARLIAAAPELIEALQKICRWTSHPSSLQIDRGSNGVRDFYRDIAREAVAKAIGVTNA